MEQKDSGVKLVHLCKTVKSGIKGIQLPEEIVSRKYPIEWVGLIFVAFNANCKMWKHC